MRLLARKSSARIPPSVPMEGTFLCSPKAPCNLSRSLINHATCVCACGFALLAADAGTVSYEQPLVILVPPFLRAFCAFLCALPLAPRGLGNEGTRRCLFSGRPFDRSVWGSGERGFCWVPPPARARGLGSVTEGFDRYAPTRSLQATNNPIGRIAGVRCEMTVDSLGVENEGNETGRIRGAGPCRGSSNGCGWFRCARPDSVSPARRWLSCGVVPHKKLEFIAHRGEALRTPPLVRLKKSETRAGPGWPMASYSSTGWQEQAESSLCWVSDSLANCHRCMGRAIITCPKLFSLVEIG